MGIRSRALTVRDEVRTLVRGYLPALFEPVLAPRHRFVIVTHGRAGSELLVELLRSQPGVRCDGELFAQRVALPRVWLRAAVARAGRRRVKVYGWKLVTHQLAVQGEPDPSAFVRALGDAGWLCIVLTRRNLLHQAISAFRARDEDQWHYRETSPPLDAVKLDPEAVVAQLVLLEARDSELARMTAGARTLPLVYEDDLASPAAHQPTVERVMAQFGMAAGPVHADVRRREPRPLSEEIANYEHVAALVRRTRFARFLDD